MLRIRRYVALGIILLGLVSLAIGTTFVVEGQSKGSFMKDAMRQEEITLGLDEAEVARGELVDSAEEAQKAGDTVRDHRRTIAPTYGDLLGGERFDPTNPEHLTYAQALNLENYLYLAVTGFGLTTVAMASGAFMIAAGVALGGAGALLYGLSRRPVPAD